MCVDCLIVFMFCLAFIPEQHLMLTSGTPSKSTFWQTNYPGTVNDLYMCLMSRATDSLAC